MMMFSAKSMTTTASCGCDWSRDWIHDDVFGKVHDDDSVLWMRLEQGLDS
jgi:hypothetical protein